MSWLTRLKIEDDLIETRLSRMTEDFVKEELEKFLVNVPELALSDS